MLLPRSPQHRSLPFAHGIPPASATIRSTPEDFRVVEDLGFSPSGEGQHQMVEIEKQELNSDQVASMIARLLGARRRDVGLAGLKDRFAVTRQWFSVDLAGQEPPDWSLLEGQVAAPQQLRVLQARRHGRKLRKGALRGNLFQLTLRNVEGDPQELERRLEQVRREGVPNYFGEQRFGRGGENVERARQMFRREYRPRGRHERGLLLSSARSELFNQVCAARVQDGTWSRPLDGDIYALAGSRAHFHQERVDQEILRRIEEHDIHPTAPLWGDGPLETTGDAEAFERSSLSGGEELMRGLEQARVKQDRRSLRLTPKQMRWSWVSPQTLELHLWLPAGSYATVVLRELVNYS